MHSSPSHRRPGPACDEGEGEHAPLVQLGGLRTGSPSTGFETSRRDVLSMLGFSLGAAGLAGCRAPVQNGDAAARRVARDGARRGQLLRDHLRRRAGRLQPARQDARRPADQDRRQRRRRRCSAAAPARSARPRCSRSTTRGALRGPLLARAGRVLARSRRAHRRRWRRPRRPRGAHGAAVGDDHQPVHARRSSTRSGRRIPTFQHVVYEPASLTRAARGAPRAASARAVVPHYRFDRARVIVGLEADFLGHVARRRWSSRGNTRATRSPDAPGRIPRPVRVGPVAHREPTPTCGCALPPSDSALVAAALLAAWLRRQSRRRRWRRRCRPVGGRAPTPRTVERWPTSCGRIGASRWSSAAAHDRRRRRSWSRRSTRCSATSAARSTVDRPSLQRQADDEAMARAGRDMQRGRASSALILYGVNPAYDYPDGRRSAPALAKVALSRLVRRPRDETAAHVHAVCPDHHFLEAWGDAEPVAGHFSLRQPRSRRCSTRAPRRTACWRWAGRPRRTTTPTSVTTGARNLHSRAAGATATSTTSGTERCSAASSSCRRDGAPRPRAVTFAATWALRVRDVARRRAAAGAAPTAFELTLRDGRAARRPPRQQPVAAGAAGSDHAR